MSDQEFAEKMDGGWLANSPLAHFYLNDAVRSEQEKKGSKETGPQEDKSASPNSRLVNFIELYDAALDELGRCMGMLRHLRPITDMAILKRSYQIV
jgi:hypothetical protein